jgi:hypothetical protein
VVRGYLNGMTTTPNEPAQGSDPTGAGNDPEDTSRDAVDDVPDDPNAEPDSDPIEPSTGALNTPPSGMYDPTARGVTRESTPTGHIPDATADDDHTNEPTDFAEGGGYDDRQLDGTREAVAERADPNTPD